MFFAPRRAEVRTSFFDDGQPGGYVRAPTAMAFFRLLPSATRMPQMIWEHYRDLLRAAALRRLVEWLNPDLATARNWEAEYVRWVNEALERYDTGMPGGRRQRSTVLPEDGGYFRVPNDVLGRIFV